jgi:hypothetical protein
MDDFARVGIYEDNGLALDLPVTPETGIKVTPAEPEIPSYLQDTYYWAYINPRNVRLLDREIVVRTILWQQHNRLQKLAFSPTWPAMSVPKAGWISWTSRVFK